MAQTVDLLEAHGATPDRTECPSPDADWRGRRLDIDQLESLCRRILKVSSDHLPTRSDTCPMSALRDELAGVIQAGVRRLAAELRRELPCWSAALEDFRQLSQCRYLPLPGSLADIHDKLEESARQAQ